MKYHFEKSFLPFLLVSSFFVLLFMLAIGLQFCYVSKQFVFRVPPKIVVDVPDIPPKEIVVALIPHQDDELFIAGKLMQMREEGKDVYAAVVTDGGGSHIRYVLNGKDENGKKIFKDNFGRTHIPELEGYAPLDRQAFAAARNREVMESLQYLGIPDDHILFLNPGGVGGSATPKYLDGSLSSSQANEVIQILYEKFGDGIYITVAEGHSDHVVLETALKKFAFISQKLFFPLDLTHGEERLVLSEIQMMRKIGALGAYKVWDPSHGRFAIGATSVEEFMKQWKEKTSEWYYAYPK